MLKGSGFYLRHPKKEEIPTIIQLQNNLEARGEFLPNEIFLPGVLEQRYLDQYSSKENAETFLIMGENETIMGRVFHFKTVPYFNSREIGYALFDQAYHGKGIMSEAVSLLTNYLFESSLLNRLEIHMNVGNIGSERVAIKCGYSKDGVAREAHFSRGRHIDVAMYSLIRRDWEAMRARQD